MAIRLTAASLSDKFEYISRLDEAVDTDRDDFDGEWKRYRDGAPEAECPLKDGIEPTRWELTPITDSRQRSHLQGFQEKHGSSGLMVAYAACGITGVTNLLDEDGKAVKLKRIREDGYWTVSEAQLSKIPAEVLVEIGAVLLTHNIPSES